MIDLQPSLESPRLRIRPLRAADFGGLYAVASDPRIWALHPARDRHLQPVFRKLFDESLASGGALVVIDKASGAIIGSSRLVMADPASGRAEIGWSFLACSHWGGAWNGEVKRLLMAHLFGFADVVFFRVAATNLRSRRAVEKIGGVLTAQTDVMQMADDAQVTHVIFQIAKADFDLAELQQPA